MYSTYNEGKSVVAEILKNKIYKHVTAVSKNVYFDVLDNIVDKYSNTHHKTIKIKHIGIESDFDSKGYEPYWSEEVFVVSKIKNTVPWTYAISDLIGEKIVGTFNEKNCQKEFRIEKNN